MKKTAIMVCLLLLLTAINAPTMFATEKDENSSQVEQVADVTEIHTAEELQAMAENPSGSYILMSDLDMTGIEWIPVDFSGKFDGNGHSILNLTLSQPGNKTEKTYDGNKKGYDTTFVAMFNTLHDAEVKGLNLVNVRAVIDTAQPCFLAGIAGYMEGSVISDCSVKGSLELRAFDRIFGIGGIAGYGGGTIENCNVDVTLICTDTDSTTLDEQFMGGVYATGFINVKKCKIIIDGYCSEYGYVHNGGIVGMYMQHPMGEGISGRITGNNVKGKITFFECNKDRRAYCSAYAGEVLARRYKISDNTSKFSRKEKKKYSVELRPEMCDNPQYVKMVTESGCDTYGYTSYCCDSCGYTYTDNYTLFHHNVSLWTVSVEPTTESEGLNVGNCDECGIELQQTIDKLEPVPTEAPVKNSTFPKKFIILIASSAIAALALIVVMCVVINKKKRKK